ncbi:N-acetylmuramoyl-L-alanine amidase [Niveibacterium umoris]|uniref:N-acetylmuramoyl-L-alanine amidase n=1 Tax=Niveibacterium umoris TaxID=1193620 RepID=A0A840BMB0_9RHOO|nr:N-acetylmuramoyl-L-alanine amidase [Niveibacterium umoris]MBB4014681.1 N-acetylmuramoyl-L-alanine amidase [Niveibacterium umoris]
MRLIQNVIMLACAAVLSACMPAAQRNPLADTWTPSPNHGARRISLVVIHHTSDGDAAQALRTLTNPLLEVSAHYLLTRDGQIVQLVDERERAWHAGQSRWGAITDVNAASIGIELDNTGDEPFPAAQMAALYRLLADLRERHRLTPLAFVGHADVAPGRKVDPSSFFPWREMARRGFGLWCDAPMANPPAGFDTALGLQAIGYDLKAPDAAAMAFALHYGAPQTGLAGLDPALVACIAEQARAVPSP